MGTNAAAAAVFMFMFVTAVGLLWLWAGFVHASGDEDRGAGLYGLMRRANRSRLAVCSASVGCVRVRGRLELHVGLGCGCFESRERRFGVLSFCLFGVWFRASLCGGASWRGVGLAAAHRSCLCSASASWEFLSRLRPASSLRAGLTRVRVISSISEWSSSMVYMRGFLVYTEPSWSWSSVGDLDRFRAVCKGVSATGGSWCSSSDPGRGVSDGEFTGVDWESVRMSSRISGSASKSSLRRVGSANASSHGLGLGVDAGSVILAWSKSSAGGRVKTKVLYDAAWIGVFMDMKQTVEGVGRYWHQELLLDALGDPTCVSDLACVDKSLDEREYGRGTRTTRNLDSNLHAHMSRRNDLFLF